MKTVISGAGFFDFEATPIFRGTLGESVLREKDGTDNQKAGDIMGYNAVDCVTGEVVIIGASHAIEKAYNVVGKGAMVKITFKGKTQNSKGQNVNVFRIDQFDSETEMLIDAGVQKVEDPTEPILGETPTEKSKKK